MDQHQCKYCGVTTSQSDSECYKTVSQLDVIEQKQLDDAEAYFEILRQKGFLPHEIPQDGVITESERWKRLYYSELKMRSAILDSRKEQEIPEYISEFIDEIIRMQKLYSNGKYSLAEQTRNKLQEKLDDIMRIK